MSDAFEKKVREKLSEGDIPFDADAWNKMEKKLDALNDDGSSRKSFWRWLAPLLLLLLGTGAFFWWRNSSTSTVQQAPVSSNNTGTVPQDQATHSDSPEEKNKTADHQQQPSAAPSAGQQTTRPAVPAPAPVTDNKSDKNRVPSAAATPAEEKQHIPSPLVDKHQPAAAPVLSYPVKEREQVTATGAEKTGETNKAENRHENILQLLATLSPKEELVPSTLTDSGRVPVKQALKPPAEKKKEQKEVPSRKGFSLTLTGGPVFNVAPSLQYGRVGVDGGLLLSYHVNNHWSFTTGAVYSQKPYGGTWRDYGVVKKRYPPDPYHVIRKIDANCGVLDVPININYAFMNTPNYTLSATAGLSSYFMLKEKYNYKYQSGWDTDREFTNANQHYLAVLNLAFTYQFPLNKNMTLGVQPFTKIPLRPVGYGEVKLYSTGVMLQLNFNSTKHKR